MARLLVFDSGLGGLSVASAIQTIMPDAVITYAADTGWFPYGTRTPDVLLPRLTRFIRDLITHEKPCATIIACNTASTLALPILREAFPDMPFIGTVPALKQAALRSTSKVIGLVATPATVKSSYLDTLEQTVASECTVIRRPSRKLASIAEDWLRGLPINTQVISEEIAPLFSHSALDTIVLGCTHYSFLREELKKLAPRPVLWLDSGTAIARHTCDIIGSTPMSGQNRCLVSEHKHGYDQIFARYNFPTPVLWDTSSVENLQRAPS